MNASTGAQTPEKRSILHFCKREMLRPLRDQILRMSGFEVESRERVEDGLKLFRGRDFDLVLVDVEADAAVDEAEKLCAEIKTEKPGQVVSFVCNWRVALLTDCPDEIVRTEFDPAKFVEGVRAAVEKHV
jgi:DNA-binding response OmpR family regulator